MNPLKTSWRIVMKVLPIYQLIVYIPPVLRHQVKILLRNQSDFKLSKKRSKVPGQNKQKQTKTNKQTRPKINFYERNYNSQSFKTRKVFDFDLMPKKNKADRRFVRKTITEKKDNFKKIVELLQLSSKKSLKKIK